MQVTWTPVAAAGVPPEAPDPNFLTRGRPGQLRLAVPRNDPQGVTRQLAGILSLSSCPTLLLSEERDSQPSHCFSSSPSSPGPGCWG